MSRCSAKNQRGQPCRAYALQGSAYCFRHDPTLAAQRYKASSRGGQHHNPPPVGADFSNADLKTSEGLRRFAEELIRLTREDKISAHRSRVLGYLMLAQRRLIEFDELALRVDALERVLKTRKVPYD